MTGKARIDGYSRIQLVWIALAKARKPPNQRELHALLPFEASMHQLDHVLTVLYQAGHIAREREDGGRYRYRAIGTMPRDGRDRHPRKVVVHRITRFIPARVDNPVILADNVDRGEVVSETNATPPAIPTLADLFARR